MGTAPALAEGTLSIESASGAERAAAARLEALEPGVHEWCMVRQCRDSLLCYVVRQDKGFELEVTDPKDEE